LLLNSRSFFLRLCLVRFPLGDDNSTTIPLGDDNSTTLRFLSQQTSIPEQQHNKQHSTDQHWRIQLNKVLHIY
jgi:hypothetical protein